MTVHYNELPTWLAFAAARVQPSEGPPTVGEARELVSAYLELACVLLLSDREASGAPPDPAVEGVLRRAMVHPAGFDDWRALYLALASTPRAAALLGLDIATPFSSEHPVGRAYEAAAGQPSEITTIGDLLGIIAPSKAPPAHSAPALRDAALALHQASVLCRGARLCRVISVKDAEGGGAEVRYRAFVGTAYPEVRVHRLAQGPPLRAEGLYFWDPGAFLLPVAPWLAQAAGDGVVVRFWAGSDPMQGGWIYRSRNPGAAPTTTEALPEGAPAFLAENPVGLPGFAPAPPLAVSPPILKPETDPELDAGSQALRRDEVDAAIREVLARGAAALSANVHPTLIDARKQVLRVIGGRSMLSYKELAVGGSLVIGRSPSHADFVVQHPKVSRRNTMVWIDAQGKGWVRDLGSTNGTRLNGAAVDQTPARLNLWDVLQVGPTLMRMELVPAEELGRIDRILAYSQDPERDPLTGLLKPKHLPAHLRLEGERFGPGDPPTGLVVYVDQLSGIHAKYGQSVAEMVFLNVARLILTQMADPWLCTIIGFGECLIVLRGDSAGGALDLAGSVLQAVADHAWVPPELEVSVTIGLTHAQPGQSVESWIANGREAALRGRAQGSALRVHRPRAEG